MRLIQLKQVIELLLPKKGNFQPLLSLGTPSDAQDHEGCVTWLRGTR